MIVPGAWQALLQDYEGQKDASTAVLKAQEDEVRMNGKVSHEKWMTVVRIETIQDKRRVTNVHRRQGLAVSGGDHASFYWSRPGAVVVQGRHGFAPLIVPDNCSMPRRL